VIAVVAAAGSVAIGCGGGEGPSDSTTSDRQQVATVAGTVADAMTAGDGETACGLMSGKGRRLTVEIVRNVSRGADVESCEAAVSLLPDTRFDGGSVLADEEHVTLGSSGNSAEVDCRGTGAFLLVRTGDGWRVRVPYCTD
jgi:hypothetical protein